MAWHFGAPENKNALTIGRNFEILELHLEERSRMGNLHADLSLLDGNGDGVVFRNVEKFLAIARPFRIKTNPCRNLNFDVGARKWSDVNLCPAGLIRLIGDPLTIWRKNCPPFRRVASGKQWIKLLVPEILMDPDRLLRLVAARLSVKGEVPPFGRPRSGSVSLVR